MDQNEDRQKIAMAACGVEGKNLYIDNQLGEDFNRTAYRRVDSCADPCGCRSNGAGDRKEKNPEITTRKPSTKLRTEKQAEKTHDICWFGLRFVRELEQVKNVLHFLT